MPEDTSKEIGEIKGMIKANHAEYLRRFDGLEKDVRGFHALQDKMKGAVIVVSMLVSLLFHGIIEAIKSQLKG